MSQTSRSTLNIRGSLRLVLPHTVALRNFLVGSGRGKTYFVRIKTNFRTFFGCIAAIAIFISLVPGLAQAGSTLMVTIVQSHKTSWRIIPASKNKSVTWAAQELQKYLEQISQCQLLIQTNSKSGPAIVVGLREELSSSDKALLPASAQGHDGYAIVIQRNFWKPDRIIIAGDNVCGTIYGVYDLLEHLGCRWFYPTENPNDPEVVPKLATISIATKSWAVASPMKFRICNGSGWFFDMQRDEAIQQLDWAMKNRYNMMGWQGESSLSKKSLPWQYKKLGKIGVLAELEKRGMTIHGPAHSFDQFLLSTDYFKDHPEWFGMRDGKRAPQGFAGAQFCWSNPEARKQYIDNAEAFITNAPLVKIFCSLPFDGGIACDCPNCKKMGASNLLMLIMSELIERLKISRPDVLVEATGGYGPATEPPTNLEIIHPQQRIVWAHWGRYHGVGYDDDSYGLKPNLEKWRKAVHNQISICQYYTDNFAEPWVMAPFTIAIEGDRKYFLQNKIDSVYMLMWPRGYWWNHSLNGYLAGHCFYDASLNPYDLIHDYSLSYYGKDAGPLLGDYYEQWGRKVDLSYHVRGDSTDEDRSMLAAQRKNWIEPALAAVKNDPLLSSRVSRVEALHTLAERLMEMHRQRAEIKKSRHAGQFDRTEELLKKSRVYTDEVLAWFYLLADINQGLMDRNEVPTFIKANVKNWIEEEEKALAETKARVKTSTGK